MSNGGLTLKRDVLQTNTRHGDHLIVEALGCSHCEGTTFKIYYVKGIPEALLYCTRCRVSYCDEGCPA